MNGRMVQVSGWVLAVNSLIVAAALALSPAAQGSARAFLGWCGIT